VSDIITILFLDYLKSRHHRLKQKAGAWRPTGIGVQLPQQFAIPFLYLIIACRLIQAKYPLGIKTGMLANHAGKLRNVYAIVSHELHDCSRIQDSAEHIIHRPE
jgi:hypothetical protein